MAKVSAAEMLRRLQTINKEWLHQKVTETVIDDQESLKKIKIDEFTHGLRPDGEKIGQYSKTDEGQMYADFKNQINPLAGFGNVDLLLTRRTANTLFIREFGKGYMFGMRDTHNLVGRYGVDILGLNQETFNQRQKDIYRYVLINDISKVLNKK